MGFEESTAPWSRTRPDLTSREPSPSPLPVTDNWPSQSCLSSGWLLSSPMEGSLVNGGAGRGGNSRTMKRPPSCCNSHIPKMVSHKNAGKNWPDLVPAQVKNGRRLARASRLFSGSCASAAMSNRARLGSCRARNASPESHSKYGSSPRYSAARADLTTVGSAYEPAA